MMKKYVTILFIALMIITMLGTFSTVFATSGWDVPTDFEAGDVKEADTINKAVDTILGVTQIVGGGVAVIMLIVLALKYISAAPNDKAEIKKHAVVYIVGAICLFGAAGILGIIRGLGKTVAEIS